MHLVKAVENLFEAGFFLEDISALDSIEGFVAVYHFSSWSDANRVVLYVVVPHETPEIPTISGIYSGARWHERESMDFFGIRFTDHPDPRPIFLPEGMTDHPLVKGDKERILLEDPSESRRNCGADLRGRRTEDGGQRTEDIE